MSALTKPSYQRRRFQRGGILPPNPFRSGRGRILHRRRSLQHGGILITTLAVSIVIAIILAGTATLTLSHLSRAHTETNYANALNLAEAGVNFEIHQLCLTPAQPDQVSLSSPSGVTYPLGTGSFRVYCANRDGSTPWTPGSKLYVVSSGMIAGVTRTIKVGVTPRSNVSAGTPFYTLFGTQAEALNGVAGLLLPGNGITVNGNIGSNGFIAYTGHPTINQGAYNTTFNGSGSDWLSGLNPAGYSAAHTSQAVVWPTVDQIANGLYPSDQYPPGGLGWLALHNDNATAVPPIASSSIIALGTSTITLYGKAGGANYYLQTLNVAAASQIVFDNTNGPITIWIGPSGGVAASVFSGGTATVKMSADSTRPVRIYDGTIGGIVINGNHEFDAGIYAVNGTSSNPAGVDFTGLLPALSTVVLNGGPNFHGQIIANTVALNALPAFPISNSTVVSLTGESGANGQGYFQPVDYYAYDNIWQEINGRDQ